MTPRGTAPFGLMYCFGAPSQDADFPIAIIEVLIYVLIHETSVADPPFLLSPQDQLDDSTSPSARLPRRCPLFPKMNSS